MERPPIDLPPDEFRRLGHQIIDLLADQLAGVRDAPVRRVLPDEVRDRLLNTRLNDAPASPDALIEQVKNDILPYPLGNQSPRFFGWVNSTPAPLGVLAELLAAAHDAPAVNSDIAAYFVELAVIRWMRTLFRFPATTGGLLTSGGSVANLIGLAAMRHMMSQGNMRRLGMTAEPARMVIYTSMQGHSCIQKAAELLGFGDGVVEAQEVKRAGGTFVGVASAEPGQTGINAEKRTRLIAAGADIIADDEVINRIQKENFLDFDATLAVPSMMPKVGRLGRILGTRGLMPNPKTGTVVQPEDLPRAVQELKAGRVEFRNDKTGNLHIPVGKASFEETLILENAQAILDAVNRVKPTAVKGTYIKKVVLTSTMGPGARLDLSAPEEA